ncbi:MAG: bifunctional diaminohydroxyphosphoribosylaminopyrimidine deaminase/5-amino-6-(5-phosphoribosylamino)uracil reductase RibD [Acidobacteriota bacterium]|nr:bifunctional diaminohydroxyphosphoribosylaminopyrimidine deaminase/5-amino-6-(5-phosphoribosylamino)uracil reductase RibD [Acidobacteriota bacterium]
MDANAIGYMQRALSLARKGTALASPNPMVGCVLVRDGQIVGEGFHQYEWRDHAEVLAIKSAEEKSQGATMYVTLEPCNHTGRTGPCTEAIIKAGIQRVVATIEDPNAEVAGRGFERIRAAGVEVFTGLMEEEARRLNEPFAKWIRKKTPLVTLKSAMTLDGQLALPQSGKRKSSTWITSEESHAEVHRMRHASDALLTGIGTVLADDPLLTDRSGLPRRRRLLRVVLDSRLRLSARARMVKTPDDDLLVFTGVSLKSPRVHVLQKAGVEVVSAKVRKGRLDLTDVLKQLGKREILSVLLEAGSTLNGAALASDIVDRVFLFYAPKIAGAANVPFAKAAKRAHAPLRDVKLHQFGLDFAVEGMLHDVYGNH